MRINADLSARAMELTGDLPWRPSPDGSVERRMLDRDGGEVARATSLVRYPRGSRFPSHSHGGGEEFLVLDGVFSDEHGHYPAGAYVRNPPSSSHAPYSEEGCTIFVKLRQFDPGDLTRVVIDTGDAEMRPGAHPGLREILLHEYGSERVRLVRSVTEVDLGKLIWPGGAEFLVLRGELADQDGHCAAGCWLRLPAGARQQLTVSADTEFYLKTGHLGVSAVQDSASM